MVRYSREDALTEREFVLLLEAVDKMKEQKQLETKFILMAAGKLGMRGGEIAHIRESWMNKHENLIEIPKHDSCNKGAFGGEICGYCRNRAKDYLDTHNTSKEEELVEINKEFGDQIDEETKNSVAEQRINDKNKTIDDVKDMWWKPKTTAAIRSIPYDFNIRLQLTVERFFEKYDKLNISKSTLNRRVDTVAEKSELNKRIYPHSLRATAATTHASRNVSPYALMSIMGWRDMETARTYISASDESAAIEVRSKHR
jgi:integrase